MNEVVSIITGLGGGISAVLSLSLLPILLVGVFLGVTIGAIPGLTGSMLIALSLPRYFLPYPRAGHGTTRC